MYYIIGKVGNVDIDIKVSSAWPGWSRGSCSYVSRVWCRHDDDLEIRGGELKCLLRSGRCKVRKV